MIIDFHTHAFNNEIAPRALENLSKNGGGVLHYTDGTISGLIASMDEAGIDRSVLLPIATKPSQQSRINDWAQSVSGERVISFGTVHPDAPDAIDELERLAAMGVKGVKFHPDYQHFYVDEARMKPIYECIARLHMITVFHAGVDIGLYPPAYCTPERLAHILPLFDGAPVVAAHFGGYMLWEQVLFHLCGKPLYLDTAYSFSHIPPRLAQRIIEKHSPEKILFASDSPWASQRYELLYLKNIARNEEELEMIAGRNAEKLLGL